MFAPLSGFFETGSGAVRTRANYPHHARLRAALGLPPDADRERVARAFAAAQASQIASRIT